MRRQWLICALLFTGSVGLVLAGFVYDVVFAGIPFQDAPAPLQAEYRLHSHIALAVELIGLVMGGAASLFAAVTFVRWSRISRNPARE